MKDRPRSKGAKKPARSHHGSRIEELELLRVKRREARWKSNPPLAAAPPSLWDIRNALDAARTSLPAALRAGWLVHRLSRTLCADFDVYDGDRMPSVLDSLSDTRFNDETDELEDIDLRPRYKTLMRHKRLWERFAGHFGYDCDADPDLLFSSGPSLARVFLDRYGASSASLARALADDEGSSRRQTTQHCGGGRAPAVRKKQSRPKGSAR